ncbi:low molecular weight protein arginine phosphatase [Evansella sp. AB-rgal1]|uniref:low molecular weight protein arginine phosphatase n=1 Tax=Evansella sp. AB-rgal1 TaxID=3242696 RepID=UPI00359E89C3
MNILFVCTGNTCRSPLAEALVRQKSGATIQVKSAGVHAMDGMLMSEGSRAALANRGISENHRAQLVNEELLQWADVVLTMTESHKRLLLERFPYAYEKVSTLKEYVYNDAGTKDKLEKIKHHIAQLELKKATFLANNQGKVDEFNEKNEIPNQEKFEQELLKLLKPDQEAIEQLESELPSFDVADPYGGSLPVYEATLKEIEAAVEKLLEQVNKK